MKEEKECQVTCKMVVEERQTVHVPCKIIEEGGVEQMKLETQSKKLEDMTDEEICAEADYILVTGWGVNAYGTLIGMGNFYGGDEITVERFMETNPEFGEALDDYLRA